MNKLITCGALCMLVLGTVSHASERYDALKLSTVSSSGKKGLSSASLQSMLSIWTEQGVPKILTCVTFDKVAVACDGNTFRRWGSVDAKYKTNDVSRLLWSDICSLDMGKFSRAPIENYRVHTLESVFLAMAGRPERCIYLSSPVISVESVAEANARAQVASQIYYEAGRYETLKKWKKVSRIGKGVLYCNFFPPRNLESETAKNIEYRFMKLFKSSENDGHRATDVFKMNMTVDKVDGVIKTFPRMENLKEIIASCHAKNVKILVYLWRADDFYSAYKMLWDLGIDCFDCENPAKINELSEFFRTGKKPVKASVKGKSK